MSLVVVGTIGIDTVETPTSRRENILGGSASYFAYAASYFTRVSLVGVVGTDFPDNYRKLLAARNIDLAGMEVADGQTFRWTGKYHENMNDRDTLDVRLNVFGKFDPKVPAADRECSFLFLANGAPAIQAKVLKQMKKRPKFVAADTMNLWIETAREELDNLLKEVDALVINDSEARLYTDQRELLRAGRELLKKGPKTIIIKKGEHGALIVSKDGNFSIPAYPLEEVIDPTGAGDTFAGGIMGYLASQNSTDHKTLRRAVAYGVVVASFTCEDFSFDRLERTKREEIDKRYRELMEMVAIPD
ncbi:MAG TPA: PfkB family carbohydrate kinase [Planctomycetota bacterium]|nr:PfkB family carbohydrate kinase [Planctomycetota bacterium]